MNKIQIIAEIGINHNGDLEIAKKLIDIAAWSGCDYVKFQKRNPDLCVPESQKNIIKNTPWGEMTYLDYKKKLEFSYNDYHQIDKYCKEKKIKWFASVWDSDSLDFMKLFSNEITKIPSALATCKDFMYNARNVFNTLLVSTGMCVESDVDYIMKYIKPDVLFHTNSTYPCPVNELNLEYIKWLKGKYYNITVGYSGHEFGLVTTFAAIAMGATWIERHITLDKNIWGTDQSSSVSPDGLIKLCRGIRDIEKAMTGYGPRVISDGELAKIKSLRK